MILIIGAGIAGVTLARSLSSKNIPFRIFDQQAEYKNQGFGLTLRADTTIKLLPLLDMSEEAFGPQVAVDRKTGKTNTFLVNVETGERFAAASFKEGASTRDFRTNRNRLRSVILGEHVPARIEYGHQLSSFTRTATGVRAVFSNGVEADGSILVAADGVHSPVRTRLLPHCIPTDWDGIMLNGTSRLSMSFWNTRIAPHIGDAAVYPGFAHQTVMALTIYDTDPDPVTGWVDISWGYSRRRHAAPTHDPLFVRYADRSFDKASAPAAFFTELDTVCARPLVEPFRSIFAGVKDRGDRTIHHQLVSLLVPLGDLLSVLERDRVVFIGDSVHDWSNHAGTAANAAIQDALCLGEVLARGGEEEVEVEAYYGERYPEWERSYEKNGEDFQVLHKDMGAWRVILDQQRDADVRRAAQL